MNSLEGTVDPADIEDLFDQLEDYSDSGPDADTISIGSTPKPSLKPFFCSSRNLLHEARSVVHAAAVAKAQSEYFFSFVCVENLADILEHVELNQILL